jgi:hypothetical protein
VLVKATGHSHPHCVCEQNATSGVNLNANKELEEHLRHGPSPTSDALQNLGLKMRQDDEFEDDEIDNENDGWEDGQMR